MIFLLSTGILIKTIKIDRFTKPWVKKILEIQKKMRKKQKYTTK